MGAIPNLGQAVLLNALIQMMQNTNSTMFQQVNDLHGEINHLQDMSSEINSVNDGNATPAISKWIAMNLRRLNARTTQLNNRLTQLSTSMKMNDTRIQGLEQQKQRALGS